MKKKTRKKCGLLVVVSGLLLMSMNIWASEVSTGEPEKVTVTATTCAPATWTLLQGTSYSSNQALFWRRIFINERTHTYKFKYTFNPLTYTVVDDYTTAYQATRPEYKISLPSGVWASTTWTAGGSIVIETITTK